MPSRSSGAYADAEYKRSAILTIAGVLEERRQLIKAELGSADEGALFQIANKFAIRHQRSRPSKPTMTQRFWTGSSGGTWRQWSSPTASSARRRARAPDRQAVQLVPKQPTGCRVGTGYCGLRRRSGERTAGAGETSPLARIRRKVVAWRPSRQEAGEQHEAHERRARVATAEQNRPQHDDCAHRDDRGGQRSGGHSRPLIA